MRYILRIGRQSKDKKISWLTIGTYSCRASAIYAAQNLLRADDICGVTIEVTK